MAADLRSDETKYVDAQIGKAIARERERCAKLAERLAAEHSAEGITGQAIADAIRKVN